MQIFLLIFIPAEAVPHSKHDHFFDIVFKLLPCSYVLVDVYLLTYIEYNLAELKKAAKSIRYNTSDFSLFWCPGSRYLQNGEILLENTLEQIIESSFV